MVRLPEELYLDFSEMMYQKLLEILPISAQVIRELENQERNSIIRDLHSIESSQDSWHKVVISQWETEWEESQFTEKNSQMRTLSSSTPNHIFCQWLMLDQTQMDLNSSLPLRRPHG